MKLETKTHKITASLPGAVQECTIANNSMAFRILATNLYTDIPRAIIRELSCNAWDAHIEAGTEDTPFKWTLPSTLNPVLKLRDYGTGMSPETVRTVYATYMDSTKRDSNDFVGAFGIGSKSPFAYYESKGLDSFTIISYYENVKYTYSAFINDNGTPSIASISEEETDEHNGIEIIIPIRNEDFQDFRRAAEQVLQFFPGAYTITNHNFDPPVREEENAYGIISRNIHGVRGWRHGILHGALVGPVLYSIDESLAENNTETIRRDYPNFHKLIKKLRYSSDGVILKLPIGGVSITPSREALTMDSKTLTTILTTADNYARELIKDVQQKLDAAVHDPIASFRILMSSPWHTSSEALKVLEDAYPGLEDTAPILEEMVRDRKTAYNSLGMIDKHGIASPAVVKLLQKLQPDVPIFVKEVDGSHTPHMSQNFWYTLENLGDNERYYVVPNIPNAILLVEALHPTTPHFIYIKDLPKRPRTISPKKATNVKRSLSVIKKSDGIGNYSTLRPSRWNTKKDQVAPSDDLYAIYLNNNEIANPDTMEPYPSSGKIEALASRLYQQGILFQKPIVAIKKTDTKTIQKAYRSKSIVDIIHATAKELFDQLVAEEMLPLLEIANYYQRVIDSHRQNNFAYILADNTRYSPRNKNTELVKYVWEHVEDFTLLKEAAVKDWRIMFLNDYAKTFAPSTANWEPEPDLFATAPKLIRDAIAKARQHYLDNPKDVIRVLVAQENPGNDLLNDLLQSEKF